uniref:NET domain-containing protein n=1 Tax=Globodera pallida TaxID=36090 RepID=A0A183CCX8_GLOPA
MIEEDWCGNKSQAEAGLDSRGKYGILALVKVYRTLDYGGQYVGRDPEENLKSKMGNCKPTDATESENASSVETVEVPPDPLINPFWKMQKAFEKKLRNLTKREKKLLQLKDERDTDKPLTTDQHDALNKLEEVKTLIEFVDEMMKLNQQQCSQYKKAVKTRERQQKLEQKARSQAPIPQVLEEEKPLEVQANGVTDGVAVEPVGPSTEISNSTSFDPPPHTLLLFNSSSSPPFPDLAHQHCPMPSLSSSSSSSVSIFAQLGQSIFSSPECPLTRPLPATTPKECQTTTATIGIPSSSPIVRHTVNGKGMSPSKSRGRLDDVVEKLTREKRINRNEAMDGGEDEPGTGTDEREVESSVAMEEVAASADEDNAEEVQHQQQQPLQMSPATTNAVAMASSYAMQMQMLRHLAIGAGGFGEMLEEAQKQRQMGEEGEKRRLAKRKELEEEEAEERMSELSGLKRRHNMLYGVSAEEALLNGMILPMGGTPTDKHRRGTKKKATSKGKEHGNKVES